MFTKFSNRFSAIALIAATSGLLITSTVAEARGRVRASGQNGTIVANQGPNGGTSTRTRGARQNADGSVPAGSTGSVRDPSGARAARGSTTTVNPDGSGRRQSAAAAGGARGSDSTSSDVTRNADGSYSGGRTSTATSASTGNTYNRSTQIDPATGKPVRSATCTDVAGNAIACPR